MFLLSAVDVVSKMVTVCEMANTVSRIGTVCVCICRQAIAISVRVYVCVCMRILQQVLAHGPI